LSEASASLIAPVWYLATSVCLPIAAAAAANDDDAAADDE